VIAQTNEDKSGGEGYIYVPARKSSITMMKIKLDNRNLEIRGTYDPKQTHNYFINVDSIEDLKEREKQLGNIGEDGLYRLDKLLKISSDQK
jgi:hypothetical protein